MSLPSNSFSLAAVSLPACAAGMFYDGEGCAAVPAGGLWTFTLMFQAVMLTIALCRIFHSLSTIWIFLRLLFGVVCDWRSVFVHHLSRRTHQ